MREGEGRRVLPLRINADPHPGHMPPPGVPGSRAPPPRQGQNTLSATGLRVSELIGIKLSHCKFDNRTVYIEIIGKGSKQRRIFITRELYDKIVTLFNSKTYLFETFYHKQFSRHYIWRELRKTGRKVLGKSISPHTLRHSFCTNMLLLKNKSLKAVSNYVGHSSTAITADMYIHDQLKVEDVF